MSEVVKRGIRNSCRSNIGSVDVSWRRTHAALAVTIHAGPEFSREHAHTDDARVAHLLLEAAEDYVGAGVRATVVYHWEHSMPATPYQERFVYVEGLPPLVFCGDAYAGPKVEGAVLSGLAAAEKLLDSASVT